MLTGGLTVLLMMPSAVEVTVPLGLPKLAKGWQQRNAMPQSGGDCVASAYSER
jgi:hypothetical protein